MTDPAVLLAEAVRAGLRDHADSSYVAGTVAARSPGKPVVGVRIPLLRGAVRAALREMSQRRAALDAGLIRRSAEMLWHGDAHEDELAACMLLRLAGVPVSAAMTRRWAPSLDNWLSVDELGGLNGLALASGDVLLRDLEFLAHGDSPWHRRLYVVALITPMRLGLDPSQVPALPEVLCDGAKPVRKAAIWLISSVLKARPSAAQQFQAVLPGHKPKSLVRLLHAPPAQSAGHGSLR